MGAFPGGALVMIGLIILAKPIQNVADNLPRGATRPMNAMSPARSECRPLLSPSSPTRSGSSWDVLTSR